MTAGDEKEPDRPLEAEPEVEVVEVEILPPEPAGPFGAETAEPKSVARAEAGTDAQAASAAYQARDDETSAVPDRRVLQVMAGPERGGSAAFFERLAIALHEAGLQQRVVIARNGERAARLEAAGLTVVQLPFRRWLDFTTGPAIAAEIADFRPDLVMSTMGRAAAVVPRAVPGHDFVHVARLGGYDELKSCRNGDHLIANTRDLVRHLVDQGWPPERCHYITNFVDTEIADPVPRARFDTPNDHDLLLAFGRLHPDKGFDTLIKAMTALPNCSLWLAGEGPEHRRLLRLARRLGVAERVRFLGWRDDVAALLAAADLLVCPSRHEVLSNVVLEAWAHSRPVVALAAQGPRELIEDGETGVLVPLEDPPALARAIDDLLHDGLRYDKLMRAGRRAYEQSHTRSAVVRRYLDFIAFVTGSVRELAEAKGERG